jgi:hypothetical protein
VEIGFLLVFYNGGGVGKCRILLGRCANTLKENDVNVFKIRAIVEKEVFW